MPMHFLRSFSAVFAVASLTWQTASFAQNCNPNTTPSTPSSQFTVHGDGTVTHSVTGLTWKVCSEGQTWSNPSGVATCTGTATTHDYDSALTLAEGHSFAGHSDWRMPSFQELFSIVETCRGNPINNMINDLIFPATPSAFFWSGSIDALAPASAWVVGFNNGGTGTSFKTLNLRVRLVRIGQSFGTFLTNGYCGAAANAPRAVAPSAGFCGDGSAPAVTTTASAFQWRCAGGANAPGFETSNSDAGATVNCSTPRQYTVTAAPNPVNGEGRLDCVATSGGVLGATAPVAYNQTASCLATPNSGYRTVSVSGCSGTATGVGVNNFTSGAVTADCTVTASFELIPAPAANGVCGSAQNAFSATAPTANLCASTAGNGAVTQVGINWNWSCSPVNGGVAANCSSSATTCTMDIDGDDFVNTQIDALIHARIAAGMTGPDVLTGFTIPLTAARRDWTSIRDHLVNRCGMTLP